MRGSVRQLFVVCGACCVVGLAVSPVTALGDGSSSEGSATGEGSGASSSLESSLVTPGSPTEGEEAQAREEVERGSPEAVAVREASRTKYERLSSEESAKLAGRAFPDLIEHPAGGPPQMPAGEIITGYPSDNAASLDLGEGKRGVLESSVPIAVQASPGQRVPVDLGLRDVGRAFEPTTAAAGGVSIPKRLADGVSLSGVGVSLTPCDGVGCVACGLGRGGGWRERVLREHADGCGYGDQADDGWL